MNKKNFKILIKYIKPHKGLFLLDMFCAILISAVELIYPYLSRTAMYNWLPEGKFKTFFVAMAIVLVAYIIKGLLYYVVAYWGHIFGISVEADMRTDLFAHVQTMDLSFFDNNRTGVLLSRITNDLFEIVELAHHGPENIVISVLTFTGALIVLYRISFKLSILLTIMMPILIVFVYFVGKLDFEASMESKKSIGVINSSIESSISGIRTSRAFSNEAIEKEKFAEATEEYLKAKRGFYVAMGIFNGGTELIYAIMPLAVLSYGGYLIFKGESDYVDLVTFMLYVSTFVSPLRKISGLAETFAMGFAGLERFNEIMDIDPKVTDKEGAKDISICGGSIDFSDVHFEYNEGEEILHGLNFRVEGGETLAVVGSSGGGKTTLCQLIPRFYDVSGGEISIDNQNVKDVTAQSLRKNIGIVQQDVFLFAQSIMENIRYGRPDATDEEVIEAAKKAEIYDDICKMPEGFNTYVGERGIMLSGGQKQRVAIARVFLKNPPILILDEATSALDSVTESNIQSAFDKLSVGRTTLIIAHRLSTIAKADRIIVIDEGNIAEEGTAKELIAKDGIYAKLYKTQNGTL